MHRPFIAILTFFSPSWNVPFFTVDDDGSDIVELVTLEEDQSPVGSESGRVQNENSPPQEQLEAKSQSKLPADVNVKLSTPVSTLTLNIYE